MMMMMMMSAVTIGVHVCTLHMPSLNKPHSGVLIGG